MARLKTVIIIPALNEERAIASVVRSVRPLVDRVIVVDNGSDDQTVEEAQAAGASVVVESVRGYGRACLAGVANAEDADILVFMDGDNADDPADLNAIVAPIEKGEADLVIGSRLTGDVEVGALTVPQRFGNGLACFLMFAIWGGRFTDLGPFRAIRKKAYDDLLMSAPTFGWTVEMQVRALKRNLRYVEVPVRYRRRIGVSKISGTVTGVIMAGAYILGTIAAEALLDFRKTCASMFRRQQFLAEDFRESQKAK